MGWGSNPSPLRVPPVSKTDESNDPPELHYSARIGWLRAAVLGANDGILSVASILVGVASGTDDHAVVLLSGVAGLVAGAMSMAAGEYVSVSSQADTESADRRRELAELRENPAGELEELTEIYVGRGLDRPLAETIAKRLMDVDAIGAHLRDELGITEELAARPMQAAWTSAVSFTAGAALPLAVAFAAPPGRIVTLVVAATLGSLALLGGMSAAAGGSPRLRAVARVTFWGAAAMAMTSSIGHWFGVSV